MAPAQPAMVDGRKGSAASTSSTSSAPFQPEAVSTPGERRPSASSGYFSQAHLPYTTRMNSDHGAIAPSSSNAAPSAASTPTHNNPDRDRDRPRPSNGRSQHYLDALAQAPVLGSPSATSTSSSSSRRKNKDGNESNGLLAFFRSASSRPPSPDLSDAAASYSNSHTRKTSSGGHSLNNGSSTHAGNGATAAHFRPVVMSGSMGSLALNSNASIPPASATAQYSNGASLNGSGFYIVNSQSQAPFVFDTDVDRRRSVESYSRSSSPERRQDQQYPHHPLQQHPLQQSLSGSNTQRNPLLPATSASHIRPFQPRTDSIKNTGDAKHRRTKSTDFGEMYGKRPGQEQEPLAHTASPAKETKKTIFNIFKKRHHHHGTSSSQQQQQQNEKQAHPDRSRKCSADDLSASMGLYPDSDSLSQYDKRHGGDGGEGARGMYYMDSTQRGLHYMVGSKKASKKDHAHAAHAAHAGQEAIMSGFVVDLNDMSGIKGDAKYNHWPLSSAAGAETWLAPESWGVQPPSTATAGVTRSLALTPENCSSEELDQSDYETWDYGKNSSSTIKIFRPDTTFTTVNCVFTITASELSMILGRKIKAFKPDTSKYHLYMVRNNIMRPMSPRERPLHILRKMLVQFGYTDQDRLEELSGKDNSFICRLIFAENGAPLTTEADFPEHTNYADVNLQKRCLPTIPIFLYSRAKDIVRLNVSYNERMDLPLDFVQICSVLRELRMAYSDLKRVPANVRSIVHLQVLDLRGNRIRHLEKARLEEAEELVTLYLQGNRLDSIPESFRTFRYLRTIDLSGNNFTKAPLVLFQIPTLEELDMSFNELTEIPEEIGQSMRMRKLLLYGNRIGPYLPKAMSNLLRLQKLDIRQNGILNLEVVNELPALEELLVDYNTNIVFNNSFKSLARASFLKCNMQEVNIRDTGDTLTFLDLSSNKLFNLAPELFEHLRSLETLKLDNNSIGSIPGAIKSLKRLRSLSISNNLLSSLPDEISQLESLVELDVHSNSLRELPVAIWMCALIALNASSNLLESFPDPPKIYAPININAGLLSASSSTATLTDLDPTSSLSAAPLTTLASATAAPSPSRSKPLPVPPVPLQSTPSGRALYASPLSNSLLDLSLGDNRLPDDVMYPLSQFINLVVLNLSHNYMTEIPRGKIPNPGQILELYLGGNQLTSLPAEDIEKLRSLKILHVNGNKLTTLPAELGKIHRLGVLDVGCNMLKYNISNWPYDWNWNWNLELKYLNMSGNKRLQIKRQNVENIPIIPSRPGNLSEFGNLTRLRILGLMDVTITDNVPENSMDRRVRTSMSTLHNMSYGMADTLGDSDNLCIWDLVHPKFQTKEDENLFGLFDGRSDRYRANCSMTSHLNDKFGSHLKIELERLEGADTVVSALRRTFLGLDRELWPLTQNEDGRGGASALVAYIKGTTLYSANVGDAIAVLVKKSDAFHVISQKHIPWNPTEAARIKRSGGFVSERGLLNGELDISRSFGQYHLVPCVNSNPFIETTTLSEDDDFLIMASNAFWNVMPYATAVDIAKAAKRDYGDLMYVSQKLRDIAISYGAKDHMVVMLIGVGDLFKKKEPSEASEYHQQNYKRPKAPEGLADA
ncbi:PH domain leucine-rich repeat-containing protein phosphatase 2, partial [Dissophora globulifera]